jgi:hypothetical protein
MKYTHHANQQADKRDILLPRTVSITAGSIVEAVVDDDLIIYKLVVRLTSYSRHKDLVMVIVPNFQKRSGIVKTVWINRKLDTHKTLDLSQYDTNFQIA